MLSYRTPPDFGAASARAGSIAEALRRSGHEIEVPRLWIPKLKYEGYLRKSLVWFGFLLSCSWWLLWEADRYDVVFYVSPWALTWFSLPMLVFARLTHAKAALDVHDAFPEVFPKRLWWVLRLAMRLPVRLADSITLAAESMSIGSKKESLLPLAVDTDVFRPLPFRSNPEFTVGYSGVLSKRYDLAMLKAANVRIHESGSMTQEGLVEWLNNCDVLVCPLVPSKETEKSSIPQKLVEYLAVGVPVVATRIGNLKSLPCLLVPPSDTPAFMGAINRLRDDSSLRERLGKEAREFAVREFSLKKMGERLAALLSIYTQGEYTQGEGEGSFGSPQTEVPQVRAPNRRAG